MMTNHPEVPLIELDDTPQLPPHDLLGNGSLTIGGPSLDQSLFSGDETVGARMFTYHGGRFHVCPHLYEGQRIKNRLARWFTMIGIGPYDWHYQVSYGGSTMASGAWSRWQAIRECKAWIDEQIRKSD